MKIGKKLLALFLGIVMVMSLLPMTVFAEGESDVLPVCSCETACTADDMNPDCPVCSAEGALPEQCGYSAVPEDTAEITENERALYVQSLIDALPDADMITEDNVDAVADQLESIDAAKRELTDAELDTLDLSRYMAAVSAWNALTSGEVAPMAAEDSSTTVTVKPEITWQRTKELAYSEVGLEGLGAGSKTSYEDIDWTSTGRPNTANYVWSWDDISKLTTDDSMTVWDYGTDDQYADRNPSKVGLGIIPQDGIFAATWNNRYYQDITNQKGTVTAKKGAFAGADEVDSYTVRKFSGVFAWPEGYDLTSDIQLVSKNDANYQVIYDYIASDDTLTAAFGGKKVIAINDDMYVFLYKEGETLDSTNYADHLVFWTGTAGKGVWSSKDYAPWNGKWGSTWNMTPLPATFGTAYATPAFQNIVPNTDTTALASDETRMTLDELETGLQSKLNQSDGWYSFMDGNAISTVLNNQYKDNVQAGDKFHIDIYCFDTDKVGGMDELELVMTKAAPSTANVTVRYWLNNVGTDTTADNYLGSSTMTGVDIDSEITLVAGTAANQLNYKKAEAIDRNSRMDVNDGIQVNKPFIVKADSDANIIDVLYTSANQKVVILTAATEKHEWQPNTSYTVNDVTVEEQGYTQTTVTKNASTRLPDRNYVQNITATRTESLPGTYAVNFTSVPFVSSDSNGDRTLQNYTIIRSPGKLEITYEADPAVLTYDFGVTNSYSGVLKDVETNAESVTVDEAHQGYVTVDKDTNTITYTPQSVNTGETVTLTLTYTGGYTCEKEVSFYPATNVLYEESFMTNGGEGNWASSGTNASTTTVDDNESTVYGYASAYEDFNEFSNGGALQAALNLNGGRRTSTDDAVTFTFTGTGFDLISECGTNTGMLVVGVKDANGKAVKAYVVDTYFCGDADKNPIISGSGILDYQVPVVRDMVLTYGTYTVTVYGYLTDASGASTSTQSSTRYAAQTMSAANSAVDADTILRDLGMSEYLGTDVRVSFMDDNSVLNGGTGAVVTSKPQSSGIFGWLKGLFSGRTAVQSASNSSGINVYLDAFRVYQPLDNETNYAENEQNLKYGSFYDYIVDSAVDVAEDQFIENCMVYMEYDGEQDIAVIKEYKNQGPQNEVYLSKDNYVGFYLEGYTKGQIVMVGAKAVSGDAALGYYDSELNVNSVDDEGIFSATEMYYDVTNCVAYDETTEEYYLILGNIGEGLLSISGIKLPEGVTPGASGELTQYMKPTSTADKFDPDTFEVKCAASAKAGRKVVITAKGSLDVAYIQVFTDEGLMDNVKDSNIQPNNTKAVANGKAKLYSFNVSVPVEPDENTFYVVAYDENDNASAPITVTVTGK